MITDSHAHLFWKNYDGDRDEVLARARAAGVERIVTVGTTLETSRACLELAAREQGVYATCGIHPHDAEGVTDEVLGELEALCRRADCVAVGETGLDHYKEYSPRRDQRRAFRWHLELARELDKPVVIHCREAHEDTASILAEFPGVRGVMHCYSMGRAELEPYLEAGLYISFSGSLTYPRSEPLREAAAAVPLERLLIETDCPFLSPQGLRGKRNEPANVCAVLERVVELRPEDRAELAQATSANAARLFGLE